MKLTKHSAAQKKKARSKSHLTQGEHTLSVVPPGFLPQQALEFR